MHSGFTVFGLSHELIVVSGGGGGGGAELKHP